MPDTSPSTKHRSCDGVVVVCVVVENGYVVVVSVGILVVIVVSG